MNHAALRAWAIRLTYASIAAHLVVGALLPFIVNAPLFDAYHKDIVMAFVGNDANPAVRDLQAWWISLFGATVQGAAVWMGGLAWIGARHRLPVAWGALIAGLLLWAPQDMAISLQANVWVHVWLDAFALAVMLPPLVALYVLDSAKAGALREVAA